MTTVIVHDAIGANAAHLPPGPAAGYTTGSGPVPWTAAQWKAHPGAVRIDQDPLASDPTADVLDVEKGAATPASCAGWARRALADFKAAKRPGQRSPAIYASKSNLANVAGALLAGGVTSGVGLWVANWNFSQAEAEAAVRNAAGPWPVIGVQFRNGATYDTSVFSAAWLGNVSGQPHGPNWTETLLQNLPTLGQGDADHPGQVQYVHRIQALTRLIGDINHLAQASAVKADGTFGTSTAHGVRAVQSFFGLDPDAVVGQKTWAALVAGERG